MKEVDEQNDVLDENNRRKLCEAEIRKNIVLVETGGELTLSLSLLNQNCDFRKKWEEIYNKWNKVSRCHYCGKDINGKGYCSERCYIENNIKLKEYKVKNKIKYREYKREYDKRPEVKEKRKMYQQRLEIIEKAKERRKEYYSRPEVKEKRKEYYSRPEVKEKCKEHSKKYHSRPEVKERRKEYYKKYKNESNR